MFIDFKKDNKILEHGILKQYTGYLLFTIAICLVEAILIIVNTVLHLKGQNNSQFYYYLVSYCFLLLLSVVAVILLVSFRKEKEKHLKLFKYFLSIYLICVLIWSIYIGVLDMSPVSINDGSIIVYLTVMMAFCCFSFLNPIWFISISISSVVVLYLCLYFIDGVSLGAGTFLNIFVFLLDANIIAYKMYHNCYKEITDTLKLYELSYVDQLTKANNRRALDEAIEKRMKDKQSFYFIILDIDSFKNVNDALGHQYGDAYLITLSDVLKSVFGEQTYRYGGDEFTIIAENTTMDEIRNKAEKVNKLLKEKIVGYNLAVSFWCS
ncbi:MAG: GGDEF domain-containing protein [Bacilli bacterium]